MAKMRSGDSSTRDVLQEYNATIEKATNLEKERNENEQDIIDEKKDLLENEKQQSQELLEDQKEATSGEKRTGQDLSDKFWEKGVPSAIGAAEGLSGTWDYTKTATEKEINIKRADTEATAKLFSGIPYVGRGAAQTARVSNQIQEIKLLMQRNVEKQTANVLNNTFGNAVEAGILTVDQAAGYAAEMTEGIKAGKRSREEFAERAAKLSGGDLNTAANDLLARLEKYSDTIKDVKVGTLIGLYKETKDALE